jgi:hypothetical protein
MLLELKAGDLYIEGSAEYGDYYSQLISWEEYNAALPEYGQQVELPTEPKALVAHAAIINSKIRMSCWVLAVVSRRA